MTRFLVAGLINLETTVRVDGFPIDYFPVRYPFHGVRSTVSGVGYNITKALVALGADTQCLSLIGRDSVGELVLQTCRSQGLPSDGVLPLCDETAQSVILYDNSGRRQINVDLKDMQDSAIPSERATAALAACDVAILCNINFTRPLLAQARHMGKLVACDVHTIGDLDDTYNADYMRHAHILFMSDEHLPTSPEDWAGAVIDRYGNDIVVIGLGAEGALLAVRDTGFVGRVPTVTTRPVVNTIGAGDALFSAFVVSYMRSRDPVDALRRAIVFASWKVGVSGAADGFLGDDALNRLSARVYAKP